MTLAKAYEVEMLLGVPAGSVLQFVEDQAHWGCDQRGDWFEVTSPTEITQWIQEQFPSFWKNWKSRNDRRDQ